MQLYALNQEKIVLASQAERSFNYTCPECQGTLRLRQGSFRQPHFYHLIASPFCRQHQKSEEHLQVQLLLQKKTEGKAFLERPFPSIQRIADVAWEEEKLIFEVQCSPISLQEAKARCEDYQKEGYHVLWILHERTFNQKRVSASEEFLRSQGAYYTNLSKEGVGEIYDQFDVIVNGRRRFCGPPLVMSGLVPLAHVLSHLPSDFTLPHILQTRFLYWGRSLAKDLVDRILQEGSFEKTARTLWEQEDRFMRKRGKKRVPWLTWIKNIYIYFLHLLLRGVSQQEESADICLEAPLQNRSRERRQESQGLVGTPCRERGAPVSREPDLLLCKRPATVYSEEKGRSSQLQTD